MTDPKGSGAPQEDGAHLNDTVKSTKEKAAGKTGTSRKTTAASAKKSTSTEKSATGSKAPAGKKASSEKPAETAAVSEEQKLPAKKTPKKPSASTKASSSPKKAPAAVKEKSTEAPTEEKKASPAKGTAGKSAAKSASRVAAKPKPAKKAEASAEKTAGKRPSPAKPRAAGKTVAPAEKTVSQFASLEEELMATLPPFYALQSAPRKLETVLADDAPVKSVEIAKSAEPKPESGPKPEPKKDEEKKAAPAKPEQVKKPVEPAAPNEAPAPQIEAEASAGPSVEAPAEAAPIQGEPAVTFKGRSRHGRGRRSPAVPLDEIAAAPVQEEKTAASGQSGDKQDKSKKQNGGNKGKPGKPQSKDSAKDEDLSSKAVEDPEQAGKKGRRKMFVSVTPGEQVEVVVAEEGQVLEYYVEMLHQAKTKGNIYKATIHNVDPNLQAAFVSYGAVKNGFLQIDEIHPEYFNTPHEPGKGRKYPPIQKVLKNGQELLVQVVKEPSGTKGAFLTTYLSLPGRYLVLTPGREQIGVSRKVDQDDERARLREMLEGLNPGPGLGVIVRTVSEGASKTNLQRDLHYLKRLWKDVRKRGTEEPAPTLIYQEMDLTARATRDYLTEDVAELWIDDENTSHSLVELVDILFPRKKGMVKLHKDADTSLFERFNLQKQIEQIHSREVVLPSGGRLVIDPTEALTAIDINSGRSGGKTNFEDMAYRTNMEAARMIPLQLRLRDIGGQIVADFIEMRDKNHWREVEKQLRAGMKADRARYDVGKIGPFGMLEIVRQRLGSSAISVSTEVCPHCKGTGVRRNMEWRSQQALRNIQKELRALQGQEQTGYTFATDADLAMHLLNHKRDRILEMEKNTGIHLEVVIGSPDA